jgi:hypothetical protein
VQATLANTVLPLDAVAKFEQNSHLGPSDNPNFETPLQRIAQYFGF